MMVEFLTKEQITFNPFNIECYKINKKESSIKGSRLFIRPTINNADGNFWRFSIDSETVYTYLDISYMIMIKGKRTRSVHGVLDHLLGFVTLGVWWLLFGNFGGTRTTEEKELSIVFNDGEYLTANFLYYA